MAETPLGDGEAIILVDRKGRRFLKRLKATHRLTIRGTVLDADTIIGRAEGSLVGGGNEPEVFRVFRPSFAELVSLLPRAAEPIFAKDAGTILTRGDVRPGHTVIEAGVGCGALSILLLRAVGPEGSLVSYELRADFLDAARENVAFYHGLAPNWELKQADARDGFEETNVDRIVLDLPDPVDVLGAAAHALRSGGILVSYVPTVLQFAELRRALDSDARFTLSETIELLERGWHVEHPSVRPEHRMVAHTGFLTFARRCAE